MAEAARLRRGLFQRAWKSLHVRPTTGAAQSAPAKVANAQLDGPRADPGFSRDDHMTCRPPAIAVSVVTDPLIDRSRRWFGFRGLAWDRFAADAVAQHQEWQPEEPECVIGAEFAVGGVDVEFFFETRHAKCRQLA
jgi:hypothetical protein